jgi:putative transcriptional regulator
MPKFVLLAVLGGLAAVGVTAQEADLAPGQFLVASRDLEDPNFAETVVLLLHYDEEHGAMGLVVNRRSDLTVARVFEQMKEAKGRTDCVYMGGPVERGNVLALLRTSVEPDDAERVFSSVYLVTSRDLLQKTLAKKVEPAVFHVYLGYAGWGPGQLEHEVSLGAWHVLRADAGSLFDVDPESVWPRLIRRTEMQIARRSVIRVRLVDAHVIDGHLLRKSRRVIG